MGGRGSSEETTPLRSHSRVCLVALWAWPEHRERSDEVGRGDSLGRSLAFVNGQSCEAALYFRVLDVIPRWQ